MFNAIFFDAVGTLIYLTNTVGHHYALAGMEVGLTLDPHQLDDAFYSAWRKCRAAIADPREDDDKAGGVNWSIVLVQVAPSLMNLIAIISSEIAYRHFGTRCLGTLS
jgi:hypothetical protein